MIRAATSIVIFIEWKSQLQKRKNRHVFLIQASYNKLLALTNNQIY